MYITREIMRNRALTEERLKAHAMKIEQAKAKAVAKAKAKAEEIKRLKEFRIPRVGDLLYNKATGILAYCDGYNGNYILMTFPGENVPQEYNRNELIDNFKY